MKIAYTMNGLIGGFTNKNYVSSSDEDSRLILKHYTNKKDNNIHEFGINYIEDHSCESYFDIRYLDNSSNESNENNKIESIKEEVDEEFDKKFEELIKLRNVKIQITDDELDFLNRQKQIQKEIEDSKKKVIQNRDIFYLNN